MATNTNPFYTYSATAGSSKTLQKPQDGGDNNQWGNYINTDLDEIVSAVNALSDKIADANEKTLVDFTATGSAVNHVGITNAAAGNGPTISAAGSESDVDLNVTAKGTGNINLKPDSTGEIVVGSGASKGKITSSGAHDLELDTNAGTNSGRIKIIDGADQNIDIVPNGTGSAYITKVDIDGGAIDGVTIGTNSVATDVRVDNLKLDGNTISSTDTDGDIDISPNGSGSIDLNTGTLDLSAQTVDVTLNNAVDALNFDSNTLSIDASNNRVGIGDASPSYKLTVDSGTVQDTACKIIQYGGYAGFIVEADSSNTGTAMMRLSSTGGGDATLQFTTDDSNRWNISVDNSETNDPLKFYDYTSSSTVMTLVNGNIGIGIDAPTTKLYVKDSGEPQVIYRTINSNADHLFSGFSDYAITANLVFRVLTGGTVYNDTGTYTVFPSDERLKTKIKETSPKLDKLLQLPIKSYYTTKDSNFKKIGVTAQDLEKVMPSLVDFMEVDETTPLVQKDDNGKLLLNDEGKPYVLDKNGDKLSKIKYTKDSLLLYCAIKAIQELSAKVTALENA